MKSQPIRKILKMIFYIIAGILCSIIIILLLYLNLGSEYGGKASSELKAEYAQNVNYENGKFLNQIPTSLNMSFREYFSVAVDFIKGDKSRTPSKPIEVLYLDSTEIEQNKNSFPRVTWFGHTTLLLEIEGKNILLDPVWGDVASPIPFISTKRYSKEIPIEIAKLPYIDAIIISHDHYDHLDYASISKLKDKVGAFYTPLGVAAHLLAWGIDADKIYELNWWDEIAHDDFIFRCTPSRHFSGRGILDRNTTLWASWVIKTKSKNIYFSGDSGYGPHFKEIGTKYGPFDFALLECGQYGDKWAQIHMLPEETVQAATDLKAELMLPIHWGAFTLSLHPWNDPIERVTKEAIRVGQKISTPQIGEAVILNSADFPNSRWWESYK